MRNTFAAHALGVLAASSCGAAPVFAKAAVGIVDGRNCTPQTSPQTIPSPDGTLAVQIRCMANHKDEASYPHLLLKRPDGSWQDMPPHEGLDEVLWGPNSNAVVINGNENGYTNYVVVYRRVKDRWREIAPTRAVQRDMVRQFPPCKAFNRDPSSATISKKIPNSTWPPSRGLARERR